MKFVFSLVECCKIITSYQIISVCFLIPSSQPATLPETLSSNYTNHPISCNEDDADISPNPIDCTSFYKCVKGAATLTRCPLHFEFHEEWKVCTWPEQANCTREVTVTDDNGSGDQSNADGANNVTDTGQVGQPSTMIFDKYFPKLKEWEARISNTTLLNIAGAEPQSNALIEADVLIFRNETAIYKRKIQIHTAEKLENSTVVAGMLEKYTVSCAILNLKYRMVADFPEPPPWCLPHLVNKVASANNLRRAYSFLNRVNDYYHQ